MLQVSPRRRLVQTLGMWLMALVLALAPGGASEAWAAATAVDACGGPCPCEDDESASLDDCRDCDEDDGHEGDECPSDCSDCQCGSSTVVAMVTPAAEQPPTAALPASTGPPGSEAPNSSALEGVFRPPRHLL